MKGSIYTALLFAFAFLMIPEESQSQTRRVYRSVNNRTEQSTVKVANEVDKNKNTQLDSASAAELDSLLKTGSGVSTVNQDGRSSLQVEVKPSSKTSQTLFGTRPYERSSDVGKGAPEPRTAGIPMVRKKADGTEVKAETAPVATPAIPAAPDRELANSAQPATSAPVARPVSPAVRQVTSSQQPYQQSNQQQSYRSYDNSDWKLFRSVRVSLLAESDRAYLRKYSVVLGSFRSYNNADFVRRTFNGLGERVIVVKNADGGNYYALLASFDDQTAAVQKLESFTRQYTTGNSKARRISKYGIPLDDLWILVND